MNRDAGDLWEFLLHAVFQRSGDVVDLGDGQAAVHGAVAGDERFCGLPRPRGRKLALSLAGESVSVYNCS